MNKIFRTSAVSQGRRRWWRGMPVALLAAAVLGACAPAVSDDQTAGKAAAADAANAAATIRKNLTQRLPGLPTVTEVRATPMPGLYEVRVGDADIFYSDARGDFLLNGSMLDTRTRTDLTHARQSELNRIDFSSLPRKDALTFTRGKGERRLAVFSDPRCPYCHRLEAELAKLDNVTVDVYVLPILGERSVELAQQIWCSSGRQQVWLDWMQRKKPPTAAASSCDSSALQRVLALAQKHRITGTPALIFADGSRVSGLMQADAIEKKLASTTSARKP